MALTSLANAQAWLGITTTNDNALLTRLINQLSDAILSHLQRPNLYRATYTEVRNGVGNYSMMLRNYPVISITSLQMVSQLPGFWGYPNNINPMAPSQVGTLTVPAASSFGQPGYTLQPWDGTSAGRPQSVTLSAYNYYVGKSNIQFVYQAGYSVLAEAHTIPASGNYWITPNLPNGGSWMQDDGVIYSTGTAMTAVTALTGTAGQYIPPQPFATIPTTYYQFNAADEGASILLNYSYVPSAVEEACIEWVGERYRYKQRIGISSQGVGGQETTSFIVKRMPDHIVQMLEPYKKDIPV